MNDQTGQPEHVLRNRALWDKNAVEYVGPGERAWARQEPTWGIWGVPESELHVFPPDLAGKDAIELGCGTAYISAWLTRRGARVVGIDNSAVQLATARRLRQEHGLELALIHGNAERAPYPGASFDLAISEYGACLWADPYRWIPEAARILRPGGALIFLVNSALLMLCEPEQEDIAASERLLRPAFGMYRVEWPGDSGVEFHLSHGNWIRLLRRSGFEIEDLIEVQAPETGTTRYPFVTAQWARQWPSEEIWKARRRSD
jgi:SAM-dependent methyltransferase